MGQKPGLRRLLLVLSRWTPSLDRVLFIDCGSPMLSARALQNLYEKENPLRLDVLTAGEIPPAGFRPEIGSVLKVPAAGDKAGRKQLLARLHRGDYSAICAPWAGSGPMNRWKWRVAFAVPVKVRLVNEWLEWFWIDRGHLGRIMQTALGTKPVVGRFILWASRWTPALRRILVVESGSRRVASRFLENLYARPGVEQIDLLTCYDDPPSGFRHDRGELLQTSRARNSSSRSQFFEGFAEMNYSAVCILCTGEPIMSRWKWAVAARVPAKVMIVNENADAYWFDRGHLRQLRSMLRQRFGRSHVSMRPMLADIVVLPFAFLFLLLFAGYLHARRLFRTS